ncbi:MAG: hypothetical protein H7101_07935, partial [Deinococcales bacterium]|nr:hypothetical protein [Chitinophagaceae bacterium]
VTNEIHYLNKVEDELVIESGIIKKILIRDNIDTAKIIATFEYHDELPMVASDKKGLYFQILNDGSYILLKYNKRYLTSKDSLFGTQKKYFLADNPYYYVVHFQKPEFIKKLNADNILAFLPMSLSFKNWIKDNKLDLRREKDAITFFKYYNSQIDKPAH